MINDSMAARLTHLRDAFAESHRQIMAASETMRAVSVRTESRDGRISLTLNSMGQITALEFRDDSYQDLAPRELSEKLVALFTEAQSDLRKAVLAQAPPAPFTGLTLEQMMDPSTDMSAALSDGLLRSLFEPGEGRGDRHSR